LKNYFLRRRKDEDDGADCVATVSLDMVVENSARLQKRCQKPINEDWIDYFELALSDGKGQVVALKASDHRNSTLNHLGPSWDLTKKPSHVQFGS
jgi:hypothetical protein